MPRTPYDPLTHIPRPHIVREHLRQTELLARRLRILLDVAERVHAEDKPEPGAEEVSADAD